MILKYRCLLFSLLNYFRNVSGRGISHKSALKRVDLRADREAWPRKNVVRRNAQSWVNRHGSRGLVISLIIDVIIVIYCLCVVRSVVEVIKIYVRRTTLNINANLIDLAQTFYNRNLGLEFKTLTISSKMSGG